MRKATLGLLFVCLVMALLSVPAGAQANFTITLPFAFQVENTTFPAGSYAFQQPASDQALTIRSQKGNQRGVFNLANLPTENPFERAKTWLVFHRYGDQYFLAQIWTKHKGQQVVLSAAEKKLRESGVEGVDVKVSISAK